jgi:hypothetical protein
MSAPVDGCTAVGHAASASVANTGAQRMEAQG